MFYTAYKEDMSEFQSECFQELNTQFIIPFNNENFDDAVKLCEPREANTVLTPISSDEEFAALNSFIDSLNINAALEVRAWIGVKVEQGDSIRFVEFVDETGDTSFLQNSFGNEPWGEGEPLAANEQGCVALGVAGQRLLTQPCSQSNRFICRRNCQQFVIDADEPTERTNTALIPPIAVSSFLLAAVLLLLWREIRSKAQLVAAVELEQIKVDFESIK